MAVLAGALVVLGYLLAPPLAPLEKANLVGYAICHQIPERSFHIAGHQLPLCARCTGTYVGVAIGFLSMALWGRWRAAELPRTWLIVVLAGFVALMGVDGLNSYIHLIRGRALLYEPRNWLRAATGSLNGIALSTIVSPIYHYTLWRTPSPLRSVAHAWQLLGCVGLAAGAIVVVQSEPAWLLYPISLLSTAGVLWMLTLVNTMIALIVLHRDSQAETWQDGARWTLFGLIGTLLELTAMGTARYLLTGTLGWPLTT
ncbi:MAG: DUF2085 domain-containing protein [Anaerolineae bacterium]|nr:DUF2085 domain-containing protein [Anaerolineae bacterium]